MNRRVREIDQTKMLDDLNKFVQMQDQQRITSNQNAILTKIAQLEAKQLTPQPIDNKIFDKVTTTKIFFNGRVPMVPK